MVSSKLDFIKREHLLKSRRSQWPRGLEHTGIVGSNLIRDTDFCMRLFCVLMFCLLMSETIDK
jgi:hypothetical protein